MEALEFLKKYLLLDEQESKEPQWIRIANLMDAYHKQKLEQCNVSGSFYCQRSIEDEDKCDTQCEHCRGYYEPLVDECKHEKSYYCLKTGGGRCRKCKKLTGQ
jgi:hypothetical protein